ncbi:Intraflagellar transport protein 57 [Gonapodya sp. JEL0774]|nr:Intraflagellar transport protein 57 [Gonapodya sp. JEL0774]
MDSALDKLRLLNYAKAFCKPRNFNPISRAYFVIPAANPNEQFFYFTSLFAWLANLAGVGMEEPQQFDDPNATAAILINALKTLNIVFEYGPMKLKQPYGPSVAYVLNALADKALQATGFSFKKPIHKNDDYPEEAEVDTEAEVTTDAIDEKIAGSIDNENDEPEGFSTSTKVTESNARTSDAPSRFKVDPAQWQLEVERVTPSLKVLIPNDVKDWRAHLNQMKGAEQSISSSFAEAKAQLSRVTAEVSASLEKISSREKYINAQFGAQASFTFLILAHSSNKQKVFVLKQIDEYRVLSEQISDVKQKLNAANGSVGGLADELARVTEELDGLKARLTMRHNRLMRIVFLCSRLLQARMDEIGSGMTDSKPLVNIKQAVTRIKAEIKQFDLRIGVISHQVFAHRLAPKGDVAIAMA